MTRLADAWATRATAPVQMLNIGDSVTERTGSGGYEAGYATRLLRSLQADAGISGGPGFVNSGSYVPTDNSLSSFYSPVGTVANEGFLGQRGGSWSTDQAVTITFTGTSISVHYFGGFGASTAMAVTIDGTPTTAIPADTTAPQNYRRVWHSPVVAHGAHTIVLTPAAGKQVVVRGIYAYDGDETAGIHGWEAGHYGTTTALVAASVTAFYQDGVTVIQPHVVTGFLGLNDQEQGMPPATFQANWAAIIAAVDGWCTVPPSWVLCAPYQRLAITPTYPLAQYRDALAELVADDPTERRLVDLATVPGIVLPDNVHPDPASHTLIAAAIRPAVLDLAGESDTAPGTFGALTAHRRVGAAWEPLAAHHYTGGEWQPLTARQEA